MADNVIDQQGYGSVAPTTNENTGGLTLAGLFAILRKHFISIIVTFVAIVAAVCVFTAASPVKYTTTTQLFATYNDTSGDQSTANDQNTGSSYIMTQIKSYPTLTTTQAVLQPVIDELNLDTSVGSLSDEIEVTNPTNTAFINISVTNGDPKLAAEIANATARSLGNVVEKSLYATGSHSVIKLSIVQPAIRPSSPSSPNWKLNLLVGILGGIILGVLVALLKDLLSKKVQNDEEVTELLDAPIVGRIPEDEELQKTSPAVIDEPGGVIAEDFRRIRTNFVVHRACRWHQFPPDRDHFYWSERG
ncbi:MAG: Wzz/FepE/Etk N-terminal domain-containing protein [Bifidobacterium sp.]|nr:Wzz/FepE/Etk N-terminal domain-containing protein [Bifidobacterium sp.]